MTFSPDAQQVQTLEMLQEEQKLLLESVQRQHQEDLDLLKSTHRYQALACAPLRSHQHCPLGDKDQGSVPLPARPQPGHSTGQQLRVQGSDCGGRSSPCLSFPTHKPPPICS